jgi:hypothetical protein
MKGLFCRFYPDDENPAQDFANQLPVFKLSMAKLQGHMLKYRESAKACIENAKELLLEDRDSITKDMFIDEWLHRLNLLHLKPNFEKQKIRRVQDLVHINDAGILEEFEIADKF